MRWVRAVLMAGLVAVATAVPGAAADTPSPNTSLTVAGRQLDPAGRMTPVGAFPTGGALTPDGRFYWAVDGGRGANYIRIIETATREVKKTLPLPAGYVGTAFAPSGKAASVSASPPDGPPPAGAKGPGGDVIHVY